jgi:hypothetical protein
MAVKKPTKAEIVKELIEGSTPEKTSQEDIENIMLDAIRERQKKLKPSTFKKSKQR